jgi:hypothetical protein
MCMEARIFRASNWIGFGIHAYVCCNDSVKANRLFATCKRCCVKHFVLEQPTPPICGF